ncbi:MAG: 1-deoxy-D-xylulose-5-phosphate reductoisomerase, partial [Elusimicrobia bacterium]|nr:1-deoxy-D-xylulose-5-phosphate reductoisomerase [Elusimicrobiota bacterium]
SIGVNALDVVRQMPGEFEVVALSAHSNADLLSRQARTFKPKAVSLFDADAAARLKQNLNGFCTHERPGAEGLVDIASRPDVDLVLMSLVGGVGFKPLLAALRSGKAVALANKEPMVMAGAQLMAEAKRCGGQIIPVDSEPSAIFQCLQGGSDSTAALTGGLTRQIRKVFLTASGGAFYKHKGSLAKVTVEQALKHPTWKMGRKITIDCATLMNKGFEAIEIMNLFGLTRDQVEIVIHPQSIVHSAVEFTDGTVLAQMSLPDMRLPIQYAMTYPRRTRSVVEPLDLVKLGELTFKKPDFRRFPCLALAREAAKSPAMSAVLSAADEVAVTAFVDGRIPFTSIAKVIEKTMKLYRAPAGLPDFDEVEAIDRWARTKAREFCGR